MSQAGSENFPLDSSGETISDDTHFLETWEVSQTDQNLKQLTTDIPKPSLGSKDDGHSHGAAKSLRDSFCLSGDGRAGGCRSGESHWRFKLQQGADWSYSEQTRPQIQTCQQPGTTTSLMVKFCVANMGCCVIRKVDSYQCYKFMTYYTVPRGLMEIARLWQWLPENLSHSATQNHCYIRCVLGFMRANNIQSVNLFEIQAQINSKRHPMLEYKKVQYKILLGLKCWPYLKENCIK